MRTRLTGASVPFTFASAALLALTHSGAPGQVPPAPAAPALSLGTGVEAWRQGDRLLVRSGFSADQDVLLEVGKGANRQINFQQTRLVKRGTAATPEGFALGIVIHGCGDDATPWNLNGTYIGANHGCSDMREVTSPAHGRSAADLGSEWKDEAGTAFYLIKVVDADKLWFLSANSGTGAIWKFNGGLKGKALTRADPPLSLPVAAVQMNQLRPGCRIARQEYLLDGTTPLVEGQAARGRFLDVVEEYDIVNPGALLQDIVTHRGQARDFTGSQLQGVVRNRIRYRFLPYGATEVRHDSEALQEFRLGYMGFIQTAKLNTGTFARHDYYIPRTLAFTQDGINYDFQARQDYRGKLPSPLSFGAARKNVDPERLPDRFVQFLGNAADAGAPYQVGYAVGYSITQGITVPATRARNVNQALMLYTSSKTYPAAIDAKMPSPIPAGTTFTCVAYRQYFDPALCPAATGVYWHLEDRDLMVYADFHRAANRVALPLPVEAAGKPLTVVDKTESVTVGDTTVAADGTVTLSVAGTYGFAVLRVAGVGE